MIRGGAVIAELRAPLKNTNATSGRVIPDFMGQMREVFGDQVFPLGTGLKWINDGRGK